MASTSTWTSPTYDVDDRWEQTPAGMEHRDVAAVGVDTRDRVYVFSRNPNRVLVYDASGTFLDAWGADDFSNSHGITVGPDDSVYCVDNGDHTVRKFSTTGELLLTLGTPDQPSDTGYEQAKAASEKPTIGDIEFVQYGGPPFNRCTNLAVAPNGELYVSDGYGNCRVHRFSADGKLLQSWGEPGSGPGQFRLPHAIWIAADGKVVVADRENDRLQFFSPDGEFLEEWTDVQRPCAVTIDRDGLIYVAELWRPAGSMSFVHGRNDTDLPGRMSVYSPSGDVLARWGASTENRCAPGNFIAPHGVCVDSVGNVYVAEVTWTFAVRPGQVPEECGSHQLQKFTRR